MNRMKAFLGSLVVLGALGCQGGAGTSRPGSGLTSTIGATTSGTVSTTTTGTTTTTTTSGTTTTKTTTTTTTTTGGGPPWAGTGFNQANTFAVQGLGLDPTSPTTLYVSIYGMGGANGGLFKSTDGGATWNPINNGYSLNFGNAFVSAFAVDPTTPTTVWASDGMTGTYKTLDGGQTWVLVDQQLGLGQIQLDPADSNTVYVGGGQCLRKTSDGGATWSTVGTGVTGTIGALAIDPTGALYAATASAFPPPPASFVPGGIWKSVDGGLTFTSVQQGSWAALAVDAAGTVYAGSSSQVISRSTDGGATWTTLSASVPYPTGVSALATFPPSTVYASVQGDLLVTTDGGATWSSVGSGLLQNPTEMPGALAVDPLHAGTLYVGTDQWGIWKTTTGGR